MEVHTQMRIKYNAKFVYFGKEKNNFTLALPYPSDGIFESATTVQTQESANGEIVGQVIGRTRDKQNMTWSVLDREKWWEINNWIENNIKQDAAFSFYCKYFNFNLGRWMIRQFYPGNRKCKPFAINSDDTNLDEYGKPRLLLNCQMNIIDCGILEDDE